jgi:transposase
MRPPIPGDPQSLPDWIASHVRAFDFFGGVTAQIVSDNLKAGVTKACLYDPAINRTYADLARHYDTALVPARPHKPKDKAKVSVLPGRSKPTGWPRLSRIAG